MDETKPNDILAVKAIRVGMMKLREVATSRSEFVIGCITALAAAGTITDPRFKRATMQFINSQLVGGFNPNVIG